MSDYPVNSVSPFDIDTV